MAVYGCHCNGTLLLVHHDICPSYRAYSAQPWSQREASLPLHEVGTVLNASAGEVTDTGANELAWSHTADESEAGP